MKNERIYPTRQVLFDFQCYEDFSKMPVSEKGLHCAACDRHLIDFSKLSRTEIDLKLQSGEKICGVFGQGQMTHDVLIHPLPKKQALVTRAAAQVLLAMGALLSGCAQDPLAEMPPEIDLGSLTNGFHFKPFQPQADTPGVDTSKLQIQQYNGKTPEIEETEQVQVVIPEMVTGGVPMMNHDLYPIPEDPEQPCEFVEEPAAYGDTLNGINAYIREHLKYPEKAREMQLQGKVYVECIIGKDGEVREATLKRGVHPLLDEAALELFRNMPNWKPARHQGKNVTSRLVVPIHFRL